MIGITLDSTERLGVIVRFLERFRVRPWVRLICDMESDGFKWDQLLKPCEEISKVADIMITVADSYYISKITPAQYEKRTQKVLDTYGKWIQCVEVGNEIAGDWLGPEQSVLEKVHRANALVRNSGVRSAVTWYLDGSNQNQMWGMIDRAEISADWHLISWYPNWTPNVKPDWDAVFRRLGTRFPYSSVGFGEFGAEPRRASQAKKASLIREIYSIRPKVNNFIGLYFYWSTFRSIQKNEREILDALVEYR